ncbi:MAG: hypothetical protein IIZ39_11530 [Blautia sp.]|nr:hypothetical protein [Blautia sp.]
MKLFKGKPAGKKALIVATFLGLVGAISYMIFAFSANVFSFPICALLWALVVVGILGCAYDGFLADYLPPIMAALSAAGLVRLGWDSVDDLTAFFVGMGNYFGNADNVGPRVFIFALILLTALVTMVGAFLGKEQKQA